MSIELHKGDLPDTLDLGKVVAIDTETMGLKPRRDKLCLLQISSGDGIAHLVQFDRSSYDCPNVKKILADENVMKIFHFARFDIAVLQYYLGVVTKPVYCTRTASKLVRTYTDRHGLRENCRELLGIEISKQQQSSDWGAEDLTEAQMEYAAGDVYHLHALKEKMDAMLKREGRTDLARRVFDYLPTRAELDNLGWNAPGFLDH
ncbi:MAG: ribonuclease D [Micavibrio sp.]|nr:ribonuclease D [Micavibrio sp.]|tara:strand:+ start:23887 stop:24498 length:612 start_codon:yes stop_codon:yes gene_type:complete